jgi:hypothetical protein
MRLALSGLMGQNDEETRGQEHKGITPTGDGIGMRRNLTPMRKQQAPQQIAGDQATEQHDFGANDPPHG